ncbi:MAG: tetratricopeptide repeat protein [Pseudomonadota bacterium]
MALKFSSKEIHFLKTDSDDLTITPPQSYFCDLILSKTDQIKAFEKRLENTDIPLENFFIAIMKVGSDIPDKALEKVKTTFENTFNLFLDHERGIWENLEEMSFVLAFWDYDNTKKASQLLESLKEKMSTALKTDILMGVASFPFHDFTKAQTLENALKAIDHAAFFGPNALIHFDAISLNISGDRFYQLNESFLAQKEYKKGLEIKPKDINLINSLGVCYGVTGELDKARKEFERATKINPKEVMVIYNIGLLYRIDDDIDKAIVYLRKAHGINDHVFEVELLLGHLLFIKGLPDQALPHLESAIRINPNSGAAHRIKGEIFLADKQPDNAAMEFNRAIKLNPSDAACLSGYAKCLELQGKNLNIALSFARNSIALEPDNKLFKHRLAVIQKKIDIQIEPDQIKTA